MSHADWQRHHHEHWGRRYEAKDVKVDWHRPSDVEIDFAIELLKEIVFPALDTVDSLLREASESDGNRSSTWTNDFCRVSVSRGCQLKQADARVSQYLNIVRSALSGIPSLAWIPLPQTRGQVASDAGLVALDCRVRLS